MTIDGGITINSITLGDETAITSWDDVGTSGDGTDSVAIGKTTTARIVAKALNCLNGIENICKKNFCEK